MTTNHFEMAKRALPCPFCGKSLIVTTKGPRRWLGHPASGGCFLRKTVISTEAELTAWNTRSGQATDALGGKATANSNSTGGTPVVPMAKPIVAPHVGGTTNHGSTIKS